VSTLYSADGLEAPLPLSLCSCILSCLCAHWKLGQIEIVVLRSRPTIARQEIISRDPRDIENLSHTHLFIPLLDQGLEVAKHMRLSQPPSIKLQKAYSKKISFSYPQEPRVPVFFTT